MQNLYLKFKALTNSKAEKYLLFIHKFYNDFLTGFECAKLSTAIIIHLNFNYTKN